MGNRRKLSGGYSGEISIISDSEGLLYEKGNLFQYQVWYSLLDLKLRRLNMKVMVKLLSDNSQNLSDTGNLRMKCFRDLLSS